MRAALLAPVLFAACSFSAPGDGTPASGDAPGPDDGGNGGDGAQACPDDDQDGVCNAVDDWPCRAKPNDPGDSKGDLDVGGGRAWSTDHVTIGTARRVIAGPNQEFAVDFDWSITLYCGGPSTCKGQLEYGYKDAPRTDCFFDGDVNSLMRKDGHATTTFRAPGAPGVYELRLNAGKRSSCGTTSWYGGAPGGNATIAILCVPP